MISSMRTSSEPNPLIPLQVKIPVSSSVTCLIFIDFPIVLWRSHIKSIISPFLLHSTIGLGKPDTGQFNLMVSPMRPTFLSSFCSACGGPAAFTNNYICTS